MRDVLTDCLHVPIAEAVTPKPGPIWAYHNSWWIVTDDQELLFYKGVHAQCNCKLEIATLIRNRLYADMEVRHIEWVFRGLPPGKYC